MVVATAFILGLGFGAWWYVKSAPNPEPLLPDALPARELSLPPETQTSERETENDSTDSIGASIDALDLGPSTDSMFADIDADIKKL